MRIRRSRPKGDFVQLPNATVRDERLSHMARGILSELLSRPDGWEATADDMWRASVAVHGKSGPGRRQFRAAFAELKKYGYLTASTEAVEGGRHATILTLTDVPPCGTSVRPAETHESAGGADVPASGTSVRPGQTGKSAGPTDVPQGGTSESPAKTHETPAHADMPQGGTSAPPAETPLFAGRTDVPHGGTSKDEDVQTNTGRTRTTPAAVNAPAPKHHLDTFGAFWIAYPKKRDREEAKRAWIAAIERGAEPKRMVDAAVAYARERASEDSRFTKFPATWLTKGCYDDEPDPVGTPRLRAVSGGYEPYRNPTDQSVYDEDL